MYLKGVILVVAFVACQAAEHAYSAQSIVIHHKQKDHEHKHVEHEQLNVEHKEHKHEIKYEEKKDVKHEHKQEVKHEVKQEIKHEHKEEHKNEHHKYKPGFSSQHIERHDIPAHPPKGWNDHHGHAKYEFEYKVHDPHTHDSKHQHETRDHDVVKGEYSLHQPDGTIRTVKYHADHKNGFHADVHYEGHAKHIVPEHHHHHH